MQDADRFYIDGKWVEPTTSRAIDVIDPSTEQPIARVALGGAEDVDRAVRAARAAFGSFSRTTLAERITLLERIIEVYRERRADLAKVLTAELGTPAVFAGPAQVDAGLDRFTSTLDALRAFRFEEMRGTTLVRHEPIGVCGLITSSTCPPLLIATRLAPALAAGCTVVLKPSELAPLNAVVLAEILHAAGVPAGVFNLVHGDGPTAGAVLTAHPDVDMVSFTGSTDTCVAVARSAAWTGKRVTATSGGRSVNILLDDVDLATAIPRDLGEVCANPGGSRWLVPRSRVAEVERIAREAAEAIEVGRPDDAGVLVGPLISQSAYDRAQRMIGSAVEEGATIVAGGLGRPAGLDTGYFVRPTVLTGVTDDMEIAQEEIVGPVVAITTFADDDEAVRIADDMGRGLSCNVSSADPERARGIARRLRAGTVHVNGSGPGFGGYGRSGTGREHADLGLREFLEVKSIVGFGR